MPTVRLQDLDVFIPPQGKVLNYWTGKIEDRPIIKRSKKKEDQYWERSGLPEGWRQKRAEEVKIQEKDPTYVDHELEEFRRREWDRRLNGVWFMNNGNPEYLTGLHYFYLSWWKIDIGYPDFRKNDWEWFMVIDHVIKDDNCGGLVSITKRREGKTAKSGVFIYEFISRTSSAYGGIQSKNDEDAKKNVYMKFVVNPFKHLPDFFRPNYDKSRGVTPTSELLFFNSNRRGKDAELLEYEDELESWINYKSSKDKAYDGTKLHRYVSDESAKLESGLNVYERNQVVKFCIEENGKIIGKILHTTTIEDMGGVDERGKSTKEGGLIFKSLFKDSNQNEKNDNGRTASWLYRFFMPAYKTIFFDKYGYPDEERAKAYYIAERKAVEYDSKKLNSVIRKAPFTIEEAFRVDSDNCLFNAMNLNNQLDFLSAVNENDLYTIGNIVDIDGKMEFRKNDSGRWKIRELPDEDLRNGVRLVGNSNEPKNAMHYVAGVDPYSHSKVTYGTGSKGAAYVFKRDSISKDGGYFVCQYIFRPATTSMFYEDMKKMLFFYGCPVLIESNKQGLIEFLDRDNSSRFMLWVPGSKNPGIPASPKSHQELAEVTELYIEDNCDKVAYKELIDDWIDFDIDDTEKFDAAMAAGWALVGDKLLSKRFHKKSSSNNLHESKMFTRRKA